MHTVVPMMFAVSFSYVTNVHERRSIEPKFAITNSRSAKIETQMVTNVAPDITAINDTPQDNSIA